MAVRIYPSLFLAILMDNGYIEGKSTCSCGKMHPGSTGECEWENPCNISMQNILWVEFFSFFKWLL